MKLYTYFRSTASYRVRIALNLKGIPFDSIPIDLRKGDQKSESYVAENPQGLVPYIVQHVIPEQSGIQETSGPDREISLDPCFRRDDIEGGDSTEALKFGQSLVILDYLEKTHPTPALLPTDPGLHWKTKELAQFIACEIHPLNNLRVLKYLQGELKLTDDQKEAWYFHWLKEGFDVLEKELTPFKTSFALSEDPTWVDICLIPQMYNAHRFGFELTPYPRLRSIEAHCLTLDAFQKAAPESQSDCDL